MNEEFKSLRSVLLHFFLSRGATVQDIPLLFSLRFYCVLYFSVGLVFFSPCQARTDWGWSKPVKLSVLKMDTPSELLNGPPNAIPFFLIVFLFLCLLLSCFTSLCRISL